MTQSQQSDWELGSWIINEVEKSISTSVNSLKYCCRRCEIWKILKSDVVIGFGVFQEYMNLTNDANLTNFGITLLIINRRQHPIWTNFHNLYSKILDFQLRLMF